MRSLVNISSLVVNSEIHTEVIEGVEFTVIPSRTLPPNVVMNSILYDEKDVEASIGTLDMSPVTIGHPVVNGKFAPASDPISQAAYGILGAHNRVKGKTDDGRWVVEKLIPTEQLQNTERGKKLAEAIKHKRPIHTSTGVYLTKEPEIGVNAMGQEYTSRAKIDRFDHDAILLNEIGAATPEQGVGLFVNADGEQEVEVMYCNLNLSSGDDYSMSAETIKEMLEEAAKEAARQAKIPKLTEQGKENLKNIYHFLSRYNICERIGDLNEDDTRLIIYPTINYILPIQKIVFLNLFLVFRVRRKFCGFWFC